MNALLQKPARRRVVRVNLESRPDAEIYVRALTGAELSELFGKLRATDKRTDSLASQLEYYCSDADGAPALTSGQGFVCLDALDGIDVQRIIKAGDQLNVLSDKAIEEERKN